METGTLMFSLEEHDDAVRKVIFSPDDKYFATGSDDETAMVRGNIIIDVF